jgi:predicted TIM-barrel fold metal-dependent hydrolase
MKVEFWAYQSGCSTTQFRCGGITWYNKENRDGYESRRYKGIELVSINREVCEYLSAKLEKRMRELGFEIVSKEPQNSRFGYYDVHYYFGW